MVTDAQVRLLRKRMAEGKTLVSAAAAAGMSERSARTWKRGALPSDTKEPRSWRTRPDPLAGIWESEVVPLLAADTGGVLEATTVLSELQRRRGDSCGAGQLRTLQRRMQEWRALHGPGKEVMFEQRHGPGREGAFDFTEATDLGVTVAGQVFAHLLFQFVLSFSKWRWVGLAFSETFEALVHGLQDALAAIGGAPPVWRSDNLSAATHQIPGGGRELNRRFAAVLDHYGASSTRIEPGESHQNGIAEKAHHILKSRLTQALVLRGSDGASGRGAGAPAAAATDTPPRVQRVPADRARMEHDPLREAGLLGTFAPHRMRGRGAAIPGHRRGLVPRQEDRDHAAASR